MASFYHVLDSESNSSTRENNHGGDFTVDLHDELLLAGNWEVALAEMTYYGQHFPNLLHEHGEVSISRDEKRYSTDFVVEFAHVHDMTITTWTRDMHRSSAWVQHRWFAFQRRHYTWNQFKKMFNSWYVSAEISPDDKYTINLGLTDTTMTISLPDSYVLKKDFCITFSDPLVRLLSLPDKDFYFHESRTQHKTTIAIVPPKSIVDNSQLLFRPNKTHPIEIAFAGNIVRLSGIHWTMKTINEAWKQVCKFQTTDQIYIEICG